MNNIICKICQRQCNGWLGLSSHISQTHKFQLKDYYDKYLKKKGEGICLECGKETNFFRLNIGYYSFCSYKCSNRNKDKQEKIKQSCIKNLGVSNPSQSEKLKIKKKKTLYNNYGLKGLSNLIIKKKKIQIYRKKYGVDHPSQTKEFHDKCKQTCKEKYGYENWNQTSQGRQMHREDAIKQRDIQYNNGEPLAPRIGNMERIVLNKIEKYSPIKFLRNSKRFGYFPDGLIKTENLKIDIEYDEGDHKYQQKYDKIRDECFMNNGYTVLRIKESDWLEDKKTQIQKVIETINFLKQLSILTLVLS